MKTRLQTLDRLRSLYAVMTHMRGVALEQAAAAVRDAEKRIEGQRELQRRSSVHANAALYEGDKPEWMMQEAQRGFSEREAAWLVRVREERESAMLGAAEVYRADRMQLEQMQGVIRGLRATLDRERAHRNQMDSDDRFLSRQRWRERETTDPDGRS